MADPPFSCAVVGAGPMGMATVRALLDRSAAEVTLIDRDGERLARGAAAVGSDRLRLYEGEAAAVVDACDVVAAAVSWADSQPLLARAATAPLRIVTVGRPPPEHTV